MSDELLRAIGRVEGQLQESAKQREEQGHKIGQVSRDIHQLRNDITGFVHQQGDHGRRIANLESGMATVAAMIGHGERIKTLEEQMEPITAYLDAQKGIRAFLKWAFTAGCGAVGATAAAWGLWPR